MKVKEKRSKEGRKGKKGMGVSFESEEVNEDEGMEELKTKIAMVCD